MDRCASEQRLVDPEQHLSNGDVARIASLHVSSIEDSLPLLLGERFARGLYHFLARSDREIVFVERVASTVESVCVVSFDPRTLRRRILCAMLPLIAWRALVAVVSRKAFRRRLWHIATDTLGRSAGRDDDPAKAPEITYVFTNPDLRGARLGQRIVERVDAVLLSRGYKRYFVKTIDEPSNRALRFYSDNGFECLGPRVEGGRTFVEFRKPLTAS
jgi:GNAT superfamily N-acetyltransferase